MRIELVPDLKKYPHIYDAQENERLIVFVGAGLSALWGCHRWKDMAFSLVNSCYESGDIDYWVKDTLLTKYSTAPRKLITIAKGILKDKYFSELKKTLEVIPAKKNKLPDLMNNLFSLNASFITTNIDLHFSKLFDSGNIHSDPNKYRLKTKNIIHLHGTIEDENSLVMTVDEYLARYNDRTFRDFLKQAFFDDKNCFLFIGYGIDEMEIIDFMIQKYSKGSNSLKKLVNHFYVLLPFFQQEEQLYEYEQMYFDQISMTVIPYSINANGYAQLEEILSSWRKVFEDKEGDGFYEFNKIIDRNL
jgi:hypothetical protein